MAPNLYDSSERAYAASMSAFASQPLARSKRRRASVGSTSISAANAARAAIKTAPPPAPTPALATDSAQPSMRASAASAPAGAVRRHATAQPSYLRAAGVTHERDADAGVNAVAFSVRHASSSAGGFSASNLLEYSTRTCWQSFARAKETIVLALESKTLLSEIRILNKNACAVDVSLAVEDRPRSYVTVKHVQTLPHSREASIRIGFIPCQFIRLEFTRHSHASIAVHSVMPLGVACSEIADGSGPSLGNLLSHATENLLFGSSLRASQPFMDFLSDHRSGSPEWMTQHRTHLIDERIARLEAALFT